MVAMHALETSYKGWRFRSRLEARWAVFFDALGLPYDYEREGFTLADAGAYLPDFFLPQGAWSCACPFPHVCATGGTPPPEWLEVKPSRDHGNAVTQQKARRLASATSHTVTVCAGDPYSGAYQMDRFYAGGHAYLQTCQWIECPWCTAVWISLRAPTSAYCCPLGLYCRHCLFHGEAHARHHGCQSCTWGGTSLASPVPPTPYSGTRLLRAFRAARSARFEYGESGSPRQRR